MKLLSHGWLVFVLCLTQVGWAAENKGKNKKTAKVHTVAPEVITESTYLSAKEINEIAAGLKKKTVNTGRSIASEDLLSAEFKAFRDELISVRDGIQFEKVLTKYVQKLDSKEYDKDDKSNDIKFVLARMRAFLPMKGIIWRMTPLVHNVPVSQQILLATLRNLVEQTMIIMPDSHLQAQMMFLSMPLPGVKATIPDEAEFTEFLLEDVAGELRKSVKTLESMFENHKMFRVTDEGRNVGLVYDTKLRFGTDSFNGNDYAAYERYKGVGYGELLAAMARIHRRLAAIEIMGAYDWKGHFNFRREMSKKFGMGVAEDKFIEKIQSSSNEALPYISGMTRAMRNELLMSPSFEGLYRMVEGTGNGSKHLENAYFHLSQSAHYLVRAWDTLEKEDTNLVWQLDPEIFQARKEQTAMGIANIRKIFYDVDFGVDGKGAYGSPQPLVGSLSNEQINFDLKKFMTDKESQPRELRDLFASEFNYTHRELMALRSASNRKLEGISAIYGSLKAGKKDLMTIETTIAGASKSSVETFRDYAYERATGWKASTYEPLFGKMSSNEDVAHKMGILNEVRGAKYATMLLTPFIR